MIPTIPLQLPVVLTVKEGGFQSFSFKHSVNGYGSRFYATFAEKYRLIVTIFSNGFQFDSSE